MRGAWPLLALQVPLFVWAPEEDGQFQQGRYSRWWSKQSVAVFQRQLEQLGSRLVLRRATETLQELKQVVQETGARSVFFNHLYDPISLVRDHEVSRVAALRMPGYGAPFADARATHLNSPPTYAQVKAELGKMGVECRGFNGDLLYEPWEVLGPQGQPFTSFDAFWAG